MDHFLSIAVGHRVRYLVLAIPALYFEGVFLNIFANYSFPSFSHFPFLELYYLFVRTAGLLATPMFVVLQLFGSFGSAFQEVSPASSSNLSTEF